MQNISADNPASGPAPAPEQSSPAAARPAGPTDTGARVVLRSFALTDLPHLIALWNRAYAQQRNFQPLTPELFQTRIFDCPAFAPEGLILAWEETGPPPKRAARLVGMVHAFRPPPAHPVYARWGPHPGIAHLYVLPRVRRRGIGSRLLQAAENWLYYCPVYIGAPGQACYGTIEGPRAPLFGSTQALTLDARDTSTIRFFANRGYRAHEPGDISLRCLLDQPPAPPATPHPPLPAGMRLVEVTHQQPFAGKEPPGRDEYSLWGDNGNEPYAALLVVDREQRLFGHLGWYPMARAGHAAIGSFWLAPNLRGRKLGAWLLDRALQRIYHAPAPTGGYRAVEVHTHSVRHPIATRLYEQRGFQLEAAWAALVKM